MRMHRIAGVPVCNKSAAQWIERQRIAGVPPALLIEPVLRSNAVLLRANILESRCTVTALTESRPLRLIELIDQRAALAAEEFSPGWSERSERNPGITAPKFKSPL